MLTFNWPYDPNKSNFRHGLYCPERQLGMIKESLTLEISRCPFQTRSNFKTSAV